MPTTWPSAIVAVAIILCVPVSIIVLVIALEIFDRKK